MDKKVWEFVFWIYQHYGRLGCVVALLIIIGVLVLTFYFLNRLPEPKENRED